MLRDEERKELEEVARSPQLRKDLRKIAQKRYDPFMVNGKIDLDRLVVFLTEYNNFVGHNPRPFRRIIDKVNKL